MSLARLSNTSWNGSEVVDAVADPLVSEIADAVAGASASGVAREAPVQVAGDVDGDLESVNLSAGAVEIQIESENLVESQGTVTGALKGAVKVAVERVGECAGIPQSHGRLSVRSLRSRCMLLNPA
jgi:hypothetical protein